MNEKSNANTEKEFEVNKEKLESSVTIEKLDKIVKKAPKILDVDDNVNDLKIEVMFKVGRFYWDQNKNFKKKEICFDFQPTVEERTKWENQAFPKLSSLLTYLKNKFGGLDKFEIIFFRKNKPKSFYFEPINTKTNVYVNLDSYQKYAEVINPVINQLKVSKYARKIKNEYSKKVPIAFFNNEPPSSLVTELKKSNYKVIEDIINEYENMEEGEKKDLKTILEHSKLGNDTIEEFKKLKPGSPAKQLKLFMKIKDKLSKKEMEILFTELLKSESSRKLISVIGELSTKDQKRISKKLPAMTRMYEKYEQLEKSLGEFKKKIKEHLESDQKDEKDIHKLLAKDYWLLGIEYYGRQIKSDIDKDGKRTGETNIGRKRADFIILQRLDGIDTCVVIEIEEANDKIFNEDGTVSKAVYDGIVQAVDYSLEQKFIGIHSKGIAIIGSLKASKLSKDERKRLNLLVESFPNVEVLTYDQIIEKAETTLRFWKEREKKN